MSKLPAGSRASALMACPSNAGAPCEASFVSLRQSAEDGAGQACQLQPALSSESVPAAQTTRFLGSERSLRCRTKVCLATVRRVSYLFHLQEKEKNCFFRHAHRGPVSVFPTTQPWYRHLHRKINRCYGWPTLQSWKDTRTTTPSQAEGIRQLSGFLPVVR